MKHLPTIASLIANIIKRFEEDITPATHFQNDLDASNLDLIEILVATERAYGLPKIPDGTVFHTVGDLCAYVEHAMNFQQLITKRVAQSARKFLRHCVSTILGFEQDPAARFLRMALADFPHFFTLHPGRCFVCGCTARRACLGGCAWTDTAKTLCTVCKFGSADHPDAVIPYHLTGRRPSASEPR